MMTKMDDNLSVQIVLLIILLALSAFFSSAETALIAVSKMKIRSLAEQGNKRARILLRIFDQESKMLSAILIGNNLVNTYMATLASTIAYSFGGYALSLMTFLITFLILVFGEITPKTLATRSAEKLALFYAPIISLLMKILSPVIWFINLFSRAILRLLGVKSNSKQASITESELQTILDVSHEEGVIEADEREMIKNVFDFSDAKAREIMVPRVHVTSIDINTDYDTLKEVYESDRFTRVPVYEGNRDNIIGIVNMKDLLFYDKSKPFHLKDYIRKAYFTIENKNISDLLGEMQQDQNNMAVVLDEYGELAGILTVEDIVEEIVGQVQDEYDASENENVQKIRDGQYVVKGYLPLHDLNDELGLSLDSEDFDSVGGLIIEKLGRFPTLGESITLENGLKLRVVKLNRNRIENIVLELPQDEIIEEQQDEDKDKNKS
jgi:CBS domain containing-hemolysin-like protein